eukprot:m.141305 g.141305  ORF g.141305 m.141305 type:complete len:818 (-) comp30178_c0_seq1:182-2635(-)
MNSTMMSMVLLMFVTVVVQAELGLDAMPESGVFGVPPNNTVWTDAKDLGILGRGWPVTELPTPYSRLPTAAKRALCSNANCSAPCTVPACESARCDVWGLSLSSTGMSVKFSSSATQVHVRWSMETDNGDWLWPINGHSGVDFYVQDANTSGMWRWGVSSGNNPGTAGGKLSAAVLEQNGTVKTLTATLGVMAETSEPRNFTLYLPARGVLYNISVGVAPGDSITKFPEPVDESKPVVVYGTSILHGAAAGRAGMVYSSQMQRYINKPVVNLGFSGHGLMQQEVGEILSEIDASIFVLDCEYNMDKYTSAEIECLTYNFIKVLRKANPTAQVLLIEGHDGTKNWINTPLWNAENKTRNGYRNAYNHLIEDGDMSVFYLNGSLKLGAPIATNFEAQAGAIAGVHVSNFAFMRFAHYIGDMVSSVLNGTASKGQKVDILPTTPTQPESIPETREKASMKWVEASDLGLEGLGWPNEAPKYGRLPASAEQAFKNGAALKYTYNLSLCSTGVLTRFTTNATSFTVQVERESIGDGLTSLTGNQDDIMAYNGRFGIDVYARDSNNDGKWRWFSTSGSGSQSQSEKMSLTVNPTAAGGRDYTVYFPTHIAVTSLKIGVPSSDTLVPYTPHAGKGSPVVIWASSIGQGGVVQNTGMAWINQVGRHLDREVLNFGFSGNCEMQPQVADYLTQLKPSVFVVDCLPNMQAASVTAAAPSLFKQLRAGLGPNVPIVVLEGHTYSNAWVIPSIQQGQQAKRQAQKMAFDEAAKTDPHIHYLTGDGKLAVLGEASHDATSGIGVHPTNLAHYTIGEYVGQYIQSLPDWEK